MALIIPFERSLARETKDSAAADTGEKQNKTSVETAEIVIFPGVRVEYGHVEKALCPDIDGEAEAASCLSGEEAALDLSDPQHRGPSGRSSRRRKA